MEERSLIERLARHLAAGQPDEWPARLDEASSILAMLKDPDAAMRDVGDDAAWRRMIDAALRERWSVGGGVKPSPDSASPDSAPPYGADEEGETPLPPDAVSGRKANWVHLPDAADKRR